MGPNFRCQQKRPPGRRQGIEIVAYRAGSSLSSVRPFDHDPIEGVLRVLTRVLARLSGFKAGTSAPMVPMRRSLWNVSLRFYMKFTGQFSKAVHPLVITRGGGSWALKAMVRSFSRIITRQEQSRAKELRRKSDCETATAYE